MIRRLALLVLMPGAVAVCVSSCGRSGPLLDEGGGGGGGGRVPTYGDGHDGDLVLTSGLAPNDCRPLLSVNGDAVSVDDGSSFESGDAVLLWQVQAVFASAGNLAPVTSLERAGRWELARVTVVTSSALSLTEAPSFAFATDSAGVAQACVVPEYENLTVVDGGQLEANDWDGETGGIVAVLVRDTLRVTTGGEIVADDAGFRGGSEPTPSSTLGRRGEGAHAFVLDTIARENMANAAGGGSGGFNQGGGGGGNGGMGGHGGHDGTNSNPADYARRGFPGVAIAVPAEQRLLPGGGGGSGSGENDVAGSGGRGGGVVLLFARIVEGAGDLSADGDDGSDAGNDGGGGGGAGGTIRVRTTGGTFTGALSATGGDGGDASNNHGPGGGGGGGRISVTGLASPPAFETDVTGGADGDAGNDPHHDEPGQDGVVE